MTRRIERIARRSNHGKNGIAGIFVSVAIIVDAVGSHHPVLDKNYSINCSNY